MRDYVVNKREQKLKEQLKMVDPETRLQHLVEDTGRGQTSRHNTGRLGRGIGPSLVKFGSVDSDEKL